MDHTELKWVSVASCRGTGVCTLCSPETGLYQGEKSCDVFCLFFKPGEREGGSCSPIWRTEYTRVVVERKAVIPHLNNTIAIYWPVYLQQSQQVVPHQNQYGRLLLAGVCLAKLLSGIIIMKHRSQVPLLMYLLQLWTDTSLLILLYSFFCISVIK